MRPLLLALALIAAPALAQGDPLSYQTPAPALAALVDAPQTPAVVVGPDRQRAALLEQMALPDVAARSQPEVGLGGVRLNPRTNGPGATRYYPYAGLELLDLDAGGEPAPVAGLPAEPRLRRPEWSPDGRHLAFALDRPDRVELWVADVAAGRARRLSDLALSDGLYADPFAWLPDGSGLVVRAVPAGRGPAPEASDVPTGPVVQETAGGAAGARTYQDLLQSAHDEALFDHYFTSQLAVVGLDGAVRPLGDPAVYTRSEPAPDGRHLLVETVARPYSYVVTYGRFPTAVRVLDLATGRAVHTVADLPLAEDVPPTFGSVRTGPRSVQWRADAPATLAWAEALDGGDAATPADRRDRVYLHAVPFDGEPIVWRDLEFRYASADWGRGDAALVTEYWFPTRAYRTYRTRPDSPAADWDLLFEGDSQDLYNFAGDPMMERNDAGRLVMALDGDGVFLQSTGASPEGNRPFVRRFDLDTKASTELFRSEAPYYERPVVFLSPERFLTFREAADEPANLFVRDLAAGDVRPLTAFPHPYPELADIQKETIEYTRADGVPLSATLYLPPGYDAERDGPLPTFVWAYPWDFRNADAAGQRDDSPYQFTSVSVGGAVPFVLAGYAVLDDAGFPVVGEGDVMPNDSFREQLVMNAEAAIQAGVARGVTDPDRVAVGGHSYGAFMVGNLLAHSDLFRAGISRSGAYNRTLTPFGFQYEERSYWDAPELYNTMSPFMHAEKIDEPILLIHGAADNNPGTFTLQSERLYGAVKGLGGTARLVLLPAEAHGYRARESLLHVLWEEHRWLDQHVKNAYPRLGAADNSGLGALYAADQDDRTGTDAELITRWSDVERRDSERREEVRRLIEAGEVRTGLDHYHAAMVFQHGDTADDYRLARDHAREAVDLGYERARWLAAAAHDRYLLSIGQPQHYGTQFRIVEGVTYLRPIDADAVTDAERRAARTRTLEEIQAFLAEQNVKAADPEFRSELVRRAEADQAVQQAAIEAGRMTDQGRAAIDSTFADNAAWLAVHLDDGWPGVARVGEAGEDAAFLIVQHADHDPDLQRRALPLLAEAVRTGDAPGRHLAYLTDRVRLADGRPQLYGTQLDWDDDGCPTPKPVEDPIDLDARRAEVGLDPVTEYLATALDAVGRPGTCAAR